MHSLTIEPLGIGAWLGKGSVPHDRVQYSDILDSNCPLNGGFTTPKAALRIDQTAGVSSFEGTLFGAVHKESNSF